MSLYTYLRCYCLFPRAYVSRAANWRKFTCISNRGVVSRTRSLLSAVTSPTENGAEDIKVQISEAGDKVRALKAAKGAKGDIDVAVAELLELKSTFEKVTGTPFDQKKPSNKGGGKKGGAAKATPSKEKENDRITPRGEDYSAWYNDIVYGADLIDLSPVRGCAVIKPWGLAFGITLRRSSTLVSPMTWRRATRTSSFHPEVIFDQGG